MENELNEYWILMREMYMTFHGPNMYYRIRKNMIINICKDALYISQINSNDDDDDNIDIDIDIDIDDNCRL